MITAIIPWDLFKSTYILLMVFINPTSQPRMLNLTPTHNMNQMYGRSTDFFSKFFVNGARMIVLNIMYPDSKRAFYRMKFIGYFSYRISSV